MALTSVPHCRDCTGRFADRLLVTEDGSRVGGSYYACADYIKPGTRWTSWGPAGLQGGYRTRRAAEAVQLAAHSLAEG